MCHPVRLLFTLHLAISCHFYDPTTPIHPQALRLVPSCQDRKLDLHLIAVACLEAELGPGALNVDLEDIGAVGVDADGGEWDYLAEDGDNDA